MQSETVRKVGNAQKEFLNKIWKSFESRGKKDIDPNLPLREKKVLLNEFEKRLSDALKEKERMIKQCDHEIRRMEEIINNINGLL